MAHVFGRSIVIVSLVDFVYRKFNLATCLSGLDHYEVLTLPFTSPHKIGGPLSN